MASARLVVNTALRKMGVLAAGRDARAQDATDMLTGLQGLYGAWIAGGAFGRLRDVVPTGNTYTATGNERILRQNADVLSVSLPELVSDGWLCDYGHERRGGYFGTVVTITTVGNTVDVSIETAQPIGAATTPRDGSVVIITDREGGNTLTWLYDGTVKAWQQIEGLTLDDEAPRSNADMMGLASCLAMEMADQFPDQDVLPATAAQASRYKAAMTVRYGMRRETSYLPEAFY